jgi:hypothetical protein
MCLLKAEEEENTGRSGGMSGAEAVREGFLWQNI